MKSIQQQWLSGTLLLCLFQSSLAFQPKSIAQKRQVAATNLKAVVDPNDLVSAASAASTSLSHPELPALLSTMLTTAVQPAHGHSNPLFGPPDPFLAAGESIHPTAAALKTMGITHAKSITEMLPDSSADFQRSVAESVKQGWKVLDSRDLTIQPGNALPGFSPNRGNILPMRTDPPDSPESFAIEVKWAAGYFKVLEKLPTAAFWYALVEFFVLRPNVDVYKEDIESDPMGVAAESFSILGVRCVAFAIISILTVVFYGP